MTDVAWVALSLVAGLGNKRLMALLDHFEGDTQAVLNADEKALRQVPGVGAVTAERIRWFGGGNGTSRLGAIEQAIERWETAGIRIMTLREPDYPARLRGLDDAPTTLLIMGNWHPENDRAIAIVGTRQPSQQAQVSAEQLARQLTQRGYSIVSGLASGIDTHAHQGALDAGGYTIAVLGCGVLNVYPPESKPLCNAILKQGGTVLSEVKPYDPPSAPRLVSRNRIISGLSDGVIVVETETDGGAMHAARFAQGQGRTIYTLDLPASGNRTLIEAGAVVIDEDWTGEGGL